jgi:hypothetical protein
MDFALYLPRKERGLRRAGSPNRATAYLHEHRLPRLRMRTLPQKKVRAFTPKKRLYRCAAPFPSPGLDQQPHGRAPGAHEKSLGNPRASGLLVCVFIYKF